MTKNEILALLRNTKHLNLENVELCDEDIDAIVEIINEQQITSLNLNTNNLSDMAVLKLAECQSLVKLNLAYNNLTYQSCVSLLKLKSLRELNLSKNLLIDDKAVQVFIENEHKLTKIKLKYLYISEHIKKRLELIFKANLHQLTSLSSSKHTLFSEIPQKLNDVDIFIAGLESNKSFE